MTPDLPSLPEPINKGEAAYTQTWFPLFTADQFRAGQLAAYELGARSTAAQPAALPEPVLQALRFYANGDHYITDDAEDFDTVSGEPENWLCSGLEDSSTMIETGRIARFALTGEALNWIDGGEDQQPKPVAGEAFGPAAAQPLEPSAAPRRTTGWVAPKDRYVPLVLFNPYNGEPRDVRDVQSDPQGVLIVPPGALMLAAPPAASGDSTPPSEPVQGNSIRAPRPEPEAADEDRGPAPPRVTGSPNEIWLNYGDIEDDCTHDECYHAGGVTWCQDKVFDSDVRYVLAPPAASQQADREAE